MKISSNYSLVLTCPVEMIFCWIFLQKKWQSISICLVRSWNTRLEATWRVTWLSHYSLARDEVSRPTSSNNWCVRITSHTVWAMAQYSDSALERETTVCFLLLQDTKFSPTKIQYPVMDLLSIFELVQSTSKKTLNI